MENNKYILYATYSHRFLQQYLFLLFFLNERERPNIFIACICLCLSISYIIVCFGLHSFWFSFFSIPNKDTMPISNRMITQSNLHQNLIRASNLYAVGNLVQTLTYTLVQNTYQVINFLVTTSIENPKYKARYAKHQHNPSQNRKKKHILTRQKSQHTSRVLVPLVV